MKLPQTLVATIISASIFAGCAGSSSVGQLLGEAEMAMAADDAQTTRELCDNIYSENKTNAIYATELARLSILYMQINEHTDDPEAVELATDCYREAFKVNADSAAMFFDTLPADREKYAMTLSNIVSSQDSPTEIPLDHDSIPEDQEMI